MRQGLGRSVGAVGGREGVVDVHIAELGQLGGEGGVVLLLAGVEAQVLQQQHAAVGQLGYGLGRRIADAVGSEGHRRAQHLGQGFDHRLQAHGRHDLALGPVEVGQQHHLGALAAQGLDGGDDGAQAGVVADAAILHRHVEVDADQNALARQVAGLVQGAEGHMRSFVVYVKQPRPQACGLGARVGLSCENQC